MSQQHRWTSSLFVSACLWVGLMPAAGAATTELPLANNMLFNDPSGSGRSTSVAFVGGSSTIAFSTGAEFDGVDSQTLGGAVKLFNAAQVTFQAGDPAKVTEWLTTDAYGGDEPFRSGIAVNASNTHASLESGSGAIKSLSMAGNFMLGSNRVTGLTVGGAATVSNVRIDLASKQIIANFDGQSLQAPGVPAKVISRPDTALWTFDTITGVEALPTAAMFAADPKSALEAAGYSVEGRIVPTDELIGYTAGYYSGCSGGGYGYGYGYGGCSYVPGQPIYKEGFAYLATGDTVLSGLRLTQEGFDFLTQSLGAQGPVVNGLKSVGDFGTITLKTSFMVAVPEPQTYALMALGLAMMAGAVRRNRRASV